MEKYELIDVEGGYRFRPVAPVLYDQDVELSTDEQYRPAMRVVSPIDSFDYSGVWFDAGVLA